MSKIKRIVSAVLSILLLLMNILCFTSCRYPKYKIGIFDEEWISRGDVKIGVSSDTNVFSKDNIVLDLHIGLYETPFRISDLWGGTVSTYDEANTFEDNYHIMFTACNPFDWDTLSVEDYKHMESMYYLKEIKMNTLLDTNDYCYSQNQITGLQYNHKETIKIPEELIVGDNGEFVITFLYLYKPHAEGEEYVLRYSILHYYLTIKYIVQDNDEVVLEFLGYLPTWREN